MPAVGVLDGCVLDGVVSWLDREGCKAGFLIFGRPVGCGLIGLMATPAKVLESINVSSLPRPPSLYSSPVMREKRPFLPPAQSSLVHLPNANSRPSKNTAQQLETNTMTKLWCSRSLRSIHGNAQTRGPLVACRGISRATGNIPFGSFGRGGDGCWKVAMMSIGDVM